MDGFGCPAKKGGETVRQKRFEAIRQREMKDDLALENLDAGADLQQAQTDGVKSRRRRDSVPFSRVQRNVCMRM